MSVTIVFRTDDGAKWGTGQGSDLTPAQADVNLWNAKVAIEDLQDNPPDAVSIASISQSLNTLTVHLTDSSTQGPFTLPTIPITFRGAWTISTAYAVGDVITSGGSTYMVIYAHTSDPSAFDPGENDGSGHNYYGLLLSNPAGALPTGGSAGQFLVKTSATDYAASWGNVSAFVTLKTVTATTYSLISADIGKYIRCNNASGCTVTVPDNASVPIAVGTTYNFRTANAAGISFIEGSTGVTINGRVGYNLATDASGATAVLVKVDTDEWDLFGDLSQASA